MYEINYAVQKLQKLQSETYLASPASIFEAMAGFMRDDLSEVIDKLKQAEIELEKERAV